MKKITYKNRYDDEFTFTKDEEGNILWEGKFNYHRTGYPNNYNDAYKAYCDECNKNSINPISLEEFKEKVHEWDDDKSSYTEFSKKWGNLVYSEIDKINMVDPSGGPYISSGCDMGIFVSEEFKGMIVKEFKGIPTGYKIICK